MHGQTQTEIEEKVDFADILRLLWMGRYVVLSIVLLACMVGLTVALLLPDVYRSEATFKPAESGNSFGDMGLLGSVGALAGLNIRMSGASVADLSVEMLQSRPFLVEFARERGIVVELFAGKEWDRARNQLIIDPEIYDAKTRRWLREPDPPLTAEPSDDEIFEKMRKVLDVDYDAKTGFVHVSVTFLSPVLAQRWLSWMIEDLNEKLRRRDIEMRERSIAYLTDRMQENKIATLDRELGDLLKTEIREHMLAKVRQEYALETIAPPFVPTLKSGPNRLLLLIVSAVLGGLIATLTLVLANANKPLKTAPIFPSFRWFRRTRMDRSL